MTLPPELDEKIVLNPYNHAWAEWYQHEAHCIVESFSDQVILAIEHFGSTAVPGMVAKPVIDILVGLDALALTERDRQLLSTLNYIFYGRVVSGLDRLYARKRAEHNFNLSFVVHHSKEWGDALAIRDYLRTHEQARQEYCAVKQEAMKKSNAALVKYSSLKDPFLKELLQKARHEAQNT